jgi:hypothetical protein
VVFFAPGLACRAALGRPVRDLIDVAMTVATSIGVTIVLGLVLNALGISINRAHWADALTAFVVLAAVGGAIRAPVWPTRRSPGPPRGGVRVKVALATGSVILVALGGGVVAWVSQRHWLSAQHYTELYARPATGNERVYVRNHEGHPTHYRAVIETAGGSPAVEQFTLATGATWTDEVSVHPHAAGPAAPLLLVSLFRDTDRVAYRQIHLP